MEFGQCPKPINNLKNSKLPPTTPELQFSVSFAGLYI